MGDPLQIISSIVPFVEVLVVHICFSDLKAVAREMQKPPGDEQAHDSGVDWQVVLFCSILLGSGGPLLVNPVRDDMRPSELTNLPDTCAPDTG